MSAFYSNSGIYILNVSAEISVTESKHCKLFCLVKHRNSGMLIYNGIKYMDLIVYTASVEEDQFARSISLLTFLHNF